MAYQTVGACMAENLNLLRRGGVTIPAENQAMWNLSNAILNLSISVETDLAEIRKELRALRQDVTKLKSSSR